MNAFNLFVGRVFNRRTSRRRGTCVKIGASDPVRTLANSRLLCSILFLFCRDYTCCGGLETPGSTHTHSDVTEQQNWEL